MRWSNPDHLDHVMRMPSYDCHGRRTRVCWVVFGYEQKESKSSQIEMRTQRRKQKMTHVKVVGRGNADIQKLFNVQIAADVCRGESIVLVAEVLGASKRRKMSDVRCRHNKTK